MNALAEFLRARRGSIGPGEVGLPIGPRNRRTPGLRREELAALAGVSMDYYTRIEQGRETAPSDAVLGALARALRLTDDEHAHLLALADRTAGRLPRRRPVDASPSRLACGCCWIRCAPARPTCSTRSTTWWRPTWKAWH
ncbi:helix-turn-helix domain-containing protein [Nocardia cyriacigeorgica]|uniref:helix-turn-helix domain-containing protein n=1 Tax=Nocardia cyriacigeorgica TaxID=135487 RepID=UPI001B86DF3B